MAYRFKGWVPTVTGRLSFSIFGETNSPSQAITSNIANSDTRYIISIQDRRTLDSVIPLKYVLAPKLFGYEGQFKALCVAKCSNDATNSNDKMTGYLFLFGGKQKWKWQDEVGRLITKAQDTLNSYPGQASANLNNFFEPNFKSLPKKLMKLSSFWVKFSLSRTGVVSFSIPNNIEKYVHKEAPKFPFAYNEDLRQNRIHSVASQLFFFLKDIAHTHQHHHPKTDTMIDLYPYHNFDDFRWRCETMRVLQRRILEHKRIKNDDVYCAAKGMLAYAKSFSSICDCVVEPEWNYEPLEQSINSAHEKYKTGVANRIRKLDIARNWMIGFLGVIITVTSVLSVTDKKILNNMDIDTNIIWLATKITANPFHFFLIFLLIYYSYNVAVGNYDVGRIKIIRNSIRWTQPFHKIWSALSLMSATIFCMYIVYYSWVNFLN